MEENKRPSWVQKLFDEQSAFWTQVYPLKTKMDRINFWAASLHKSMRTQEESGLDAYAIYTYDWLKDTLEKEPNFIDMLPQIYSIWGGMFDSKKVDTLIQEHLHS